MNVLAAKSASSQAQLTSMSCPSSGNCVAGGFYTDAWGNEQAFVVDETAGVWGNAIELLPGTAALSGEILAIPTQVSCPTAGNCTVGGDYFNSSANTLPFVARQRSGAWGQAMLLPGIAGLTQGSAGLQAPSCTSSGNCAAAGFYKTSTGILMPFVANETAGAWGQPVEVPGLAALTEGGAAAESVSCSLAGDCVVGGFYRRQAFVANEFAGVWDRALIVPGTKSLNTGFGAEVTAVSCARAGTCALGGFYSVVPKSNETQVFLDTRR